jgi:hypothetical protein
MDGTTSTLSVLKDVGFMPGLFFGRICSHGAHWKCSRASYQIRVIGSIRFCRRRRSQSSRRQTASSVVTIRCRSLIMPRR